MHILVNDLGDRIRKWVEIDYENGKGLFRSDMFEMAAQEAAASLVDNWDSQFSGAPDEVTITKDVAETVAHLERWRDELIAKFRKEYQ